MRLSTGRWVSGDDFFNREADLKILENYVKDHNHVLLTGQRRMGKTSVVMELGRCLEQLYSNVVDDVSRRTLDTLEVLVHDGYLSLAGDGYRFPSRLLKDWWSARFRGHHIPLPNRVPDNK